MATNDQPKQSAYNRFLDSMVMDFDKWHDGIGFDLDALREMSDSERQSITKKLTHREQTWRELEALAVLAELETDEPAVHAPSPAPPSPPRAPDAPPQPPVSSPTPVQRTIENALSSPTADTRLAAAEILLGQGKMAEFDQFLARELRQMTRIEDGLTRALLLAELYPSETVKQALLWASWNRTDCSVHCAGLVAYLCGAAKSAFDWDLRPLFLRLGPHKSYFERKAAFDQLCELCKMTLDESQWAG